MRNLLALLATLALSGCLGGKPSPFVGEWESKHTGASIRISEGGDCRYFMTGSGGMICEWEAIDQGKARLTTKRNGVFAEGEVKIMLDELWFDTPSGGLDIFVRSP